jgi:hypothetical protein
MSGNPHTLAHIAQEEKSRWVTLKPQFVSVVVVAVAARAVGKHQWHAANV